MRCICGMLACVSWHARCSKQPRGAAAYALRYWNAAAGLRCTSCAVGASAGLSNAQRARGKFLLFSFQRTFVSALHAPLGDGPSIKRGSVHPGCILGGLRFRSTAIRIFKFVWYFQQQVLHKFFSEKRLELKSLKGQTKSEEERTPGPFLLSLRLSLKAL
jgi:hypothetical protein